MSSSIGKIILGVREFVAQTFRGLPIILLGSILAFGVFQSNFNMILFWVGMCVLVPLLTFLSNQAVATLLSNPSNEASNTFWKIFQNDTCQMVGPPSGTSPMLVFPSYWTSMIAFFFFYLMYNASSIYNMPDQPKSPKESNDRRKTQTFFSMILIGIAMVLTFIFRYALTGCETLPGMAMGLTLGGVTAYMWQSFLEKCGVGRLDDLFGIKNRILPMQVHEEEVPHMCVPVQ